VDIKGHFRQTLIERREQAGLTPAELASRAGIETAQVEAIEAGEEGADLELITKFAGSLGIPVEDLLTDLSWEPGEGPDTLGPH
jgi:transcriptional regulator with XRE-family HTH domain